MSSYKALKEKAQARSKSTGNPGPSVSRPSTGAALVRLGSEIEVRQWIRLWSENGWDAGVATVAMFPELRGKEITNAVQEIKSHPRFERLFLDAMQEIADRMSLRQDEASEILSRQATTSILDFFADDGNLLSIAEMRRLPRHKQLAIKKLKVTTREEFNKDGEKTASITQTEIEGYDIQKAIEQLSRLHQWGFSEGERDLAEMLKKAEARLHSRIIDIDAIDPEE